MESLQAWGFMGDIHIGYGFIRRKIAGNISLFWGWFVVASPAGRRFIKGFNLYAYPAGGTFMKKKCKRVFKPNW